ncbi:MAG TPA: preprotein translocase subunit SecE [Blastocatellia bacterium]|nr:preprotein translocase subunit SecE [Blastocatellia bacterium]
MAKVAEQIEEKEIGAEPSWFTRGVRWIALLPVRIGSWTVAKARAARQFYQDVKMEMKKVTWPTRQDVYGQTVVVLIVLFFFGYFLYYTNLALGYLVSKLIEYSSQ